MTALEVVLVSVGLGCLAILLAMAAFALVRTWRAERTRRRRLYASLKRDAAERENVDGAVRRPAFELVDNHDPLSAAAGALLGDDPRWHLLRAVGCMTATRGWPDRTVDTVVLFSAGTGYAVREDPQNGESLWSATGSLEHVVNSVLAVPAPNAPDAPRGAGTAIPRSEWR